MLTRTQIKKLFSDLNDELSHQDIKGEIGICGDAVMCLVFKSRVSTKDVDAIFAPTQAIRKASEKVAKKNHLGKNWLNDAAKAYFHADPPKETVLDHSHLRVWAPKAEYMLAMKCIAARYDTHDQDDVEYLIKYLELKTPKAVFKIIEKYYPRFHIPPKSQFLIEELFEDKE